jgi:hypothetical protein
LDDSEGLGVGVRRVWLGEEEILAGDLISEGVIDDGQADLSLPIPDTEALDDDGTGFLYATYTVALREDENGDGAVDEDEPILGVSEILLYYLAEEPTSDTGFQGLNAGWNALGLLVGDGENYIGYLDAIGIAQNLQVNEELTIAGEFDVAEDSTEPIRLTALPLQVEEYSSQVWSSLVFDEDLTPTWEASVSGTPHPSHRNKDTESPFSVLEVPIAYLDSDESESLHPMADETLHGVCLGDLPVVLFWIDPIRDLPLAIVLPLSGIGPGWSAWTLDSGELLPLDADQHTQLSAHTDCQLGEG